MVEELLLGRRSGRCNRLLPPSTHAVDRRQVPSRRVVPRSPEQNTSGCSGRQISQRLQCIEPHRFHPALDRCGMKLAATEIEEGNLGRPA